ncbi:MAG TPA: nucleoside triphosphate pyrophosphatase [Kofleriaceae bacterium]
MLASASPRRREMLARVGLAAEVSPADVDESALSGEAPAAYVARVAKAKAAAIAPSLRAGQWVLAADTTVTIDGAILGKAETPDEAAAMLRKLSGRTHQVLTAFVIANGEVLRERLVATDVTVLPLDAAAVAGYVASNEWRGKAGAYAIQGIAAAFVSEVRGSVTNVIGLPLAEVIATLREVGGPTPDFAVGIPA